jgi:hypothetical protein
LSVSVVPLGAWRVVFAPRVVAPAIVTVGSVVSSRSSVNVLPPTLVVVTLEENVKVPELGAVAVRVLPLLL